jgi:hypothetical protein
MSEQDQFNPVRAKLVTASGVIDLTTRLGSPGIVLSEAEVARFLCSSAVGIATTACEDPDCEVCQGMLSLWWDLCNALSSTTRIAVQRAIREAGYPLPAGPWETVG